MLFEEYQAKVAQAVRSVQQDKFDDAIALSKAIIRDEVCIDNPVVRIWPAGIIVSAHLFKIAARGREPSPGSDDYRELHQYTKLVLQDFEQLDADEQDNYRTSNNHFHILKALYQLTEAGKPLGELSVHQATPKKGGCAGVVILFLLVAGTAASSLFA